MSLGDVSGVESGEAFLQILRRASRDRHGLRGALGIFGMDSRSSCFQRARRLLESERRIRTAPSAWSTAGLILLAVISLPHLRAGQGELSRQENPKATAAAVAGDDPTEFELRVVGPDEKPVPNARVRIRTSPVPTAEQIGRGKLVTRGRYEAVLNADEEGRLVIKLAKVPTYLVFDIMTPRFGPYWASWSSESHDEAIPRAFTAQLEGGWSVGGIVVGPDGKAVEGVKINPGIEYRKRPGDLSQLGVGAEVETDAAGMWRFDSVPISMPEVYIGTHHPQFKSGGRALARGEFGIERGQEPHGKIVLDRGLTVSGKVTDDTGKPIAGALVRAKFVNEIREAKTGTDGIYRLGGCESRATRIAVSAKGRATDMKEALVEPGMSAVDFQMKPGGTVRIRVLDEKGNPAPGARIFFQRWRGQFQYFEFNDVNEYADKNGVWVWNEAPLDEFKADICPPDGMQLELQPLVARAEEYVFRTSPALVVSGKVVDAVTKQPIKKFRVVPGFRAADTEMHYARNDSHTASDGHYRIRRTRADFDLIRIEADGYQPQSSRDIKSNEGTVSIDFELTEGKNVAARVFTPAKLPAVGAKVALGVAGSQITIMNGDIEDPPVYSARADTDETGRFHFPAQDKNFQLVITHPSGFAYVKSNPEWDLTRIIHLEPWSRVEGTFRTGKSLAANLPIQLDVARPSGKGRSEPRFSVQYYSATGRDGRFVFERVIPGNGWISRRLTLSAEQGAREVASSTNFPAEFSAGKTSRVDLGGTGRAVVGKLRPPDGFKEKVRWNFAIVSVRSATKEGNSLGEQFTATVDRDGSFRIDDVPAGDYALSADFFRRDGAGRLLDHFFKVPPAKDDPSESPVDLGALTLEKR
jgi:Carboxypeptidase regulatory-like domain